MLNKGREWNQKSTNVTNVDENEWSVIESGKQQTCLLCVSFLFHFWETIEILKQRVITSANWLISVRRKETSNKFANINDMSWCNKQH